MVWGNITYNADSQPHSRPPNQNHRERDLETCMFSNQVILRLLKVCVSLTKGKSLRGKISPRSTLLKKGSQCGQVERKRLGFHPEAWNGKGEDAGSA